MSKKGGKDGGGSMDKEKELGKLYKELGALRCSPESHNTEYFQSKNLLSWNLCDRPTEDFDPEQEDWEKAVKVRASFISSPISLTFAARFATRSSTLTATI